jgi:hypothetical protein
MATSSSPDRRTPKSFTIYVITQFHAPRTAISSPPRGMARITEMDEMLRSIGAYGLLRHYLYSLAPFLPRIFPWQSDCRRVGPAKLNGILSRGRTTQVSLADFAVTQLTSALICIVSIPRAI